MMHAPPPTRWYGPLNMPKAFHRPTGAHALISTVLLADLAGGLFWVCLGGWLVGPLWWTLVFGAAFVLTLSVRTVLALLLVLFLLIVGGIRQTLLGKPAGIAWAWPVLLITSILMLFACVTIVHVPLLTHPLGTVPQGFIPILTWRPTFVPLGAAIFAGLLLLAHGGLWWRTRPQATQAHLVLSRAHPSGSLWSLVEQVYTHYRQDLARFTPLPLTRLKTPATFCYFQRSETTSPSPTHLEHEITWRADTLVIHRLWIGPKEEQTAVLFPLLARQLYDCNTPNRQVEQLLQLAHEAQASWWIALLLFLPCWVAQHAEAQWQGMERERVLERDWFAYVCGQGTRLRALLLRQLKEQTQQGQAETSVPTLAERIDHLESFLREEAQQVQHLRAQYAQHVSASPVAR